MTAPLHVETDLDLRQTSLDGQPYHAQTAAVLRWDPADPWAVALDFPDGPTWALGWELLTAVTAGQFCAGAGDVRIWRGERVYRLVLQSPFGSAMFELDPHDLAAFVASVAPRQRAAARPWIPDTAHDLLAAIQEAS